MSKLESVQRLLRRAARREARDQKIMENREWHQDRAADAEMAMAERRQKREEAGPPAAYFRTPEAIREVDSLDTREVFTPEIGEYNGRSGNYADRRARGQRGKGRRPRRREMPGAERRRIERNQQSVSW